MAYRRRVKLTCPNCDTRADEWDERVGGDRHAYVAASERCRGCEVKQAGDASLKGDEGRGVYVTLKPKGT
jgi:hypothetical protein